MATFHEEVMSPRGWGGGGFGDGGALGLVALLALMRGGWGGFGGGDGVSGLNNIQGAIDTSAIMSNLADIKAAVPLSEAQMQLALAGVQSSLSQQTNANALAMLGGFADLQKSIGEVDTNVDRQSTAVQMAIKEDGEKTRALITANQIAELNQRLTVAQLENAENRQMIREQTNSHNITMTVNQAQAQQQQQAQRQEFLLSQLMSGFGQIARATNSSVVVGSTGVSGSQTANPTNVMA